MNDRRRWHLKKELSLGDVIAFFCAAGAVVVAWFNLSERIAIIEVHAVEQDKDKSEFVSWLRRIEDKLDRIIERRSP